MAKKFHDEERSGQPSVVSNDFVRFEVFTVVTMKNAVFWDVAPCISCVDIHGATSQKTAFFSNDLVQSVDQKICERWCFPISELSCEFPQISQRWQQIS
jgi:hypothetical protein